MIKDLLNEVDILCRQSSDLHLSWTEEDQKFIKDVNQRGKHVSAVDSAPFIENKRQRSAIDAMKLLKSLK